MLKFLFVLPLLLLTTSAIKKDEDKRSGFEYRKIMPYLKIRESDLAKRRETNRSVLRFSGIPTDYSQGQLKRHVQLSRDRKQVLGNSYLLNNSYNPNRSNYNYHTMKPYLTRNGHKNNHLNRRQDFGFRRGTRRPRPFSTTTLSPKRKFGPRPLAIFN